MQKVTKKKKNLKLDILNTNSQKQYRIQYCERKHSFRLFYLTMKSTTYTRITKSSHQLVSRM